MKKIKLLITIIFIAFFCIWLWTLMLLTIRPKKSTAASPEKFKLKYENLDFTTHDGLVLKAWLIHPVKKTSDSITNKSKKGSTSENQKKIVLICHGNGREKSEYLDKALFLSKNGYYSLLFDMRGHGLSQGTIITLGAQETMDLKTIVETLNKKKGFTNFIPWGWSLGGTVSILGLEKTPLIKGAISDCPFDTYYNVVYHTSNLWIGNVPKFITNFTVKAAALIGKFDPADVNCLKVLNTNKSKPVMLVFGTKDRRVPDKMVARLGSALLKKEYTPYQDQKIIMDIDTLMISSIFCGDGCGHLKVWTNFNKEYKKRVLKFLKMAFNQNDL